jgi:TonB family protein
VATLTITGGNDDSGGQRHRMSYFILGSLVLHLVVVGAWRSSEPPGPVGQSTFKVTLLARHGDTGNAQVAVIQSTEMSRTTTPSGRTQHSESPATNANGHKQELQAVTQHIAQIRAITQPAATPSVQQSRDNDDTTQGAQGKAIVEEGARAADRVVRAALNQSISSTGSQSHGKHELTTEARYQRVRAALTRALLPVFEYPSVARRRGWQGRVKVGLFLEEGGDLSRVYLVESSGYAVLDKAAMKNVTSLRNVPAVTQWLDSSGMEVMLPVSYQLNSP